MLAKRETLLCHYQYDPLDRLVDCSLFAQASVQRFYLRDRLTTEIQGAAQRSIMRHDDQLLGQQQRQGDTVETRLFATDQQQSVLNQLDRASSHPIAYTPYGHRPAENGVLSLLGFSGERPDPVTGHYLLGNGYRGFNPVLMRFNSPDSWSPFGKGGLNTYSYCSGDPVNYSDPTGHGLLSVISTIASSAKTINLRSRQSAAWNLPDYLTPKNMANELITSINRLQPTKLRILTSADNAINHAKRIKYQGKEVKALIKAKNILSDYVTQPEKAVRKFQSEISVDSNSSGPTLVEVSNSRYNEALNSQSQLTLMKTYDLNKKLIDSLNASTTQIRTTTSRTATY